MNYQKMELDNFNLHVIKTDQFKKMKIAVNFRRNIKSDELTKRSVLINTLINSSRKYKNSRLVEIETEKLYGLGLSFNSVNSGRCTLLEFNARFLNEKYTEQGMFEKSIKFLYELIFNPNTSDGKFDEESFKLAYQVVSDDIDSIKDFPPHYSKMRLFEEINNENPVSFRKNKEDLKKITSKNLYEYYKDVIANDDIDIYIMGNLNDNMIEIVKNNFKIKDRSKQTFNHFVIEHKINSDLITIEQLKINQSLINLGYVFDEMTDFERKYTMYLLNYIIGGSADSKLHRSVREKESLCYTISSMYDTLSGTIYIGAGIDASKFNKTKDLVIKEIESVKNGEFDEDEINKGKKCYENSCISMLDSIDSVLNLYKTHEYLNSDLLDTKLENIKKVTKDDIVKLANKMNLSKIFFLKGDESNE